MGPAKLSELVTKGDMGHVPSHVSTWLEQWVATCTPRDVHIMDGTPQVWTNHKSVFMSRDQSGGQGAQEHVGEAARHDPAAQV